MASVEKRDCSRTNTARGGGEWGGGVVQGVEGGVLIASAAWGSSWRAGPAWQRRAHGGRPYGSSWEWLEEEEDKVGLGWAEVGFALGELKPCFYFALFSVCSNAFCN